MEKPFLNNQAELPTDAVLKVVLGSAFEAYSELMKRIADYKKNLKYGSNTCILSKNVLT